MKKISVSIMCADYKQLGKQIEKLNSFTNYYHFDFMDGHYVSNIMLNYDMIKDLKGIITKPIDVHLMVENPENYLARLIMLNVDFVSFHINTIENQAFRIIREAKKNKLKVGVVLNPVERVELLEYLFNILDKITVMTVDPGFSGQKFIPEMLTKIKKLKKLKQENNYNYEIEVDGSINKETIKPLIEAGTEVYILGCSGLFNLDKNLEIAIEKTKEYIIF